MSESRTELFRQVLLSLLRPIARAMIAHGVTISMATEALKQALVEEAAKPAGDEARVTDSQISLLTGLHRKDVRRLRQAEPTPIKRPLLNACALAIGHWTTQAPFVDAKGEPRHLQKVGQGDQPGFDTLVRSAHIDLPPATVLDALKARGAVVQQEGDGPVVLVRDAFIGDAESEELLQIYEKNLRAHLEAATMNLLSEGERPQFERAAHYNRLPPEAVAELEEQARTQMMAVLTELNRLALDRQRESRDRKVDGRFTVGAYILGRPGNVGADKDEDQ